jgi:hypothetical protein
MKWTFYPQHPTDPIRNPISGEFFSTEAVGDTTDALVREAVQNTLDARQKLAGTRAPAQAVFSYLATLVPLVHQRQTGGLTVYGPISKRRGTDYAINPNEAINALFRRDFQVKRQSEPGLSIVIPWYDTDSAEGLTHAKVISAVLNGFFYPILMGHLSVTVETPTTSMSLDAHSIVREVEKLPGESSRELSSMLELATWAQTRLEHEFHHLIAPSSDGAQRWSNTLLPLNVVEAIRSSFERRQPIALRVHMHVQPRDSGPTSTFLNVFLEHSDSDSSKPVFIRDELIITDVKAPRVSQVRALVIVEDRPLANLLRDAETPAHTQWNSTSSNFKNKYKFGAGAIDFVRLAVSEILRIVNQSEQKPDPSITVEYFSIPIPPESDDDEAIPARKKKPKEKKGDVFPTSVPPISPTPRRFRIDRMRGGFSIRPGDPGAEFPFEMSIRVAYDIRKGSPLKKYHEADFEFGKTPIRFEERAVRVVSAEENRMLVAVQAQDFRLDVTGFDPDRDIYVRADVKEADNVD